MSLEFEQRLYEKGWCYYHCPICDVTKLHEPVTVEKATLKLMHHDKPHNVKTKPMWKCIKCGNLRKRVRIQ